MTSIPGHAPLVTVDDLLTSEEQRVLRADLFRIAEQRRRGELAAARLVLGARSRRAAQAQSPARTARPTA